MTNSKPSKSVVYLTVINLHSPLLNLSENYALKMSHNNQTRAAEKPDKSNNY